MNVAVSYVFINVCRSWRSVRIFKKFDFGRMRNMQTTCDPRIFFMNFLFEANSSNRKINVKNVKESHEKGHY